MGGISQLYVGVYPDRESAQKARDALLGADFPEERVEVLEPGMPVEETPARPGSGEARDDAVKDIAAGTAAGGVAGVGVAAGIQLLAPALFVAAPLVAPLMVMGYGAAVGGAAGGLAGLRIRDDELDSLIKDSLEKGYFVLTVSLESEEERSRADELLPRTLAVRAEEPTSS